MKSAFLRSLLELAERDERVYLVVGDLGFGLVESFAERFPNRFLNVGVAEQNLIGISAGIALTGKIVFAYSITNFPVFRCLEQIRNDVCYHQANVKIISAGGGFAYGVLGMTHHTTEDLAIMRALPYMTVVAPGDSVETMQATRAFASESGPCYLRIGRGGEPHVHAPSVGFQLGKAIEVRRGNEVTLISTGGLLKTTLRVADILEGQGLTVRVLSMHTLKPLDTEVIKEAACETRTIITIEEHSVIGGLGSAVAEVLAECCENKVLFKKIGIPSMFSDQVGDQEYLRAQYGLSEAGILKSLEPILRLAGHP